MREAIDLVALEVAREDLLKEGFTLPDIEQERISIALERLDERFYQIEQKLYQKGITTLKT